MIAERSAARSPTTGAELARWNVRPLRVAALCYKVFSPLLTLMVWALILAVAAVPHPESPGITSVGMIDITAKVLAGLPT